MCGIVGAVSNTNVVSLLLEGLQRLEYRGYDSAGVAVLHDQSIQRVRRVGKVKELSAAIQKDPIRGNIGIAHTRWATHGVPAENNAHPHICNQRVAVVHNGIIENFAVLREQQRSQGYNFTSDTDTEVVAHQVYFYLSRGHSLLNAVQMTVKDIQGAYALGVIDKEEPETLVAARNGSPLIVGIGKNSNYIASDAQALLQHTNRFIYLENGDTVKLTSNKIEIVDQAGQAVEREIKESSASARSADKEGFEHFMLKEIHEQPKAISDTLEGRIINGRVVDEILGPNAGDLLDQIEAVQIIACGTSYHAGLVAKYWFEGIARVQCHVEVASEFRYRKHVIRPNTLFVTISQSGETADSLAALQQSKSEPYIGSLAICNVPESSLVRESDLVLMTHAGPEIGVASTKAFTTQLVALLLLVILIGRRNGLNEKLEAQLVKELLSVPQRMLKALELDEPVKELACRYANKQHALFLGRGSHYPIAMEGALKLKEISYIHAEAYASGELKHGPIALIDHNIPVIAVAPNNRLLEKLKSNLQEVQARGGELHVFADAGCGFQTEKNVYVVPVDAPENAIAPIVLTVPLQLLAYHVARLKGTDVDQPRNLAKSVTVE